MSEEAPLHADNRIMAGAQAVAQIRQIPIFVKCNQQASLRQMPLRLFKPQAKERVAQQSADSFFRQVLPEPRQHHSDTSRYTRVLLFLGIPGNHALSSASSSSLKP